MRLNWRRSLSKKSNLKLEWRNRRFDITESFIRLFLFWGVLFFFLSLEILIPYRPNSVSKVKRWVNNLALTLFNSILLNLLFASAIDFTATYA